MKAYDAADKETQLLIRSLVKKGHGKEAHVVSEILHYFPGAHVKR